jgi:intraflagellar transport protein 46
MIDKKIKIIEFFKVPRPDGKQDGLGFIILDEPSSKQSDPHVLNLQMRYTSKQPIATSLPTVKNKRIINK